MGIFSFVESAARRVMSGAVQTVFHGGVQEQEVLDALRQTMTDNVETENGRQIAPHVLIARLNPRDLDSLRAMPRFHDILRRLEARERDLP